MKALATRFFRARCLLLAVGFDRDDGSWRGPCRRQADRREGPVGALGIIGVDARPPRREGRRVARAAVLLVGFGLLLGACHKSPYPEITAETKTFGGETGHGTRVYLSSPRHSSSGSRGECGWEENVNGRTANMWAATADT